MRISAKTEYATRALVDLTLHGRSAPVQVRDIAERQNVPEKYLVQILLVLKSAGFVESRRGVDGGYLLTQPPEEITLGQVIRAVEGPILPFKCFDETASANGSWPLRQSFCAMWDGVRDAVADSLDSRTFADLARGFEKGSANMYYI